MKDLTVLTHGDIDVLDSREVAEMVEKRHDHLVRDIHKYIEIMRYSGVPKSGESDESKIDPSDFFIESTYQTSQNKTMPCFLISRKGCDMVANKMTGEKGILFTAAYVNAFEKMKKQINNNFDNLSPQLQLLINIETEQKRQALEIESTNKRIDNIGNIIQMDTNSWRKESKHLISKIATAMGGFEYIKDVNSEIYRLLNIRFGVSLETRLTNKRRRMADEGVCKSKRDSLTKVDIIADDKKLIEGYITIIKELAIKYGVDCSSIKSA